MKAIKLTRKSDGAVVFVRIVPPKKSGAHPDPLHSPNPSCILPTVRETEPVPTTNPQGDGVGNQGP